MKPLAWIAMGLVVIALTARTAGWDLLPDPVGWLLVLVGTTALPAPVGHRAVLRTLAGLALVVASVTWAPAVLEAVNDLDGDDGDSLRWAVGLPQIAYVGVLAHALVGAARAAGDRGAATWWAGVRTVAVVIGVLPVLISGGGLTGLRDAAGVITVLAPLVVIALLVVHRSRAWALDPAGSDA